MVKAEIPVPENGFTNYAQKVLNVDSNGNSINSDNPLSVGVGGLLNGIIYDYVSVTYPSSTTESYVFKQGGSSGTIVATINLTYTDSTKENLSSAEKV